MKNNYEVVVGNIGSVHQGHNRRKAETIFKTYVEQSKDGYGRAGGEQVTLFQNDDIAKEYNPPAAEDEIFSENNLT